MSKAYKCDKCGRFYNKNKETYPLYTIKYWYSASCPSGEAVDIDLCQTCMQEFKFFLNHPNATVGIWTTYPEINK